jgi:hypothetical protein
MHAKTLATLHHVAGMRCHGAAADWPIAAIRRSIAPLPFPLLWSVPATCAVRRACNAPRWPHVQRADGIGSQALKAAARFRSARHAPGQHASPTIANMAFMLDNPGAPALKLGQAS